MPLTGDQPEPAALIANECALFDSVVPDLCLMGVGLAYQKYLRNAVSL